MEAKTVNVERWIAENKEDFVPPVCNKCMFSEQLKVFFVGGPNSRKDYHLEEGEEFFYQRNGDMVLKVIERGHPRDITIKEGEIFLLPSRVEHSPQRFANTVGFVVERTRENTEFDCVRRQPNNVPTNDSYCADAAHVEQYRQIHQVIRYFVEGSTERLFERWFHLNDVVRDLPPLIRTFHCSDEYRTGKPGKNSFLVNAPYEPVPTHLHKPINLRDFIESHSHLLLKGPIPIYEPPRYSSHVLLYGEGKYSLHTDDYELLLWIMDDSYAVLEGSNVERLLESLSMTLCPPRSKYQLHVRRGQVLTLHMMPEL
ncbi:hypothetical protein Y032_0019g3933 [Ancylostoma ceylanicum]|nr:hypothetical protein Y032_0019g3933 [Ancylostoma ceylanicum]